MNLTAEELKHYEKLNVELKAIVDKILNEHLFPVKEGEKNERVKAG